MTEVPPLKPVNALEETLLRTRLGVQPATDLLGRLMESQVFVLADRFVGPEGLDDATNLLALGGAPFGRGLAVFTAQERCWVWLDRFPAFEYNLRVEFSWVLGGVAPGVSLLINPGWAEGCTLRPETLTEMKQAAGLPATPPDADPKAGS